MKNKKEEKYQRLISQLGELLAKPGNFDSKLATIAAVLHHKIDYFFWTGFYFLTENGELMVRSYQGPVACQLLEKDKGVCWAAINQGKTLVVPDVHLFPGHIACDSRSESEIVIPIRDRNGKITGVLDVDSKEKASFDQTDAINLEKIVNLLHDI